MLCAKQFCADTLSGILFFNSHREAFFAPHEYPELQQGLEFCELKFVQGNATNCCDSSPKRHKPGRSLSDLKKKRECINTISLSLF